MKRRSVTVRWAAQPRLSPRQAYLFCAPPSPTPAPGRAGQALQESTRAEDDCKAKAGQGKEAQRSAKREPPPPPPRNRRDARQRAQRTKLPEEEEQRARVWRGEGDRPSASVCLLSSVVCGEGRKEKPSLFFVFVSVSIAYRAQAKPSSARRDRTHDDTTTPWTAWLRRWCRCPGGNEGQTAVLQPYRAHLCSLPCPRTTLLRCDALLAISRAASVGPAHCRAR